jgi:predicted Zn-dependent peptidase
VQKLGILRHKSAGGAAPLLQGLKRNIELLMKRFDGRFPHFLTYLKTEKRFAASFNSLKKQYKGIADVFSYILGQASSKLQEDLVNKGLALQVQVGYQTCKFTGPITITLVPTPGRTREALAALDEHIAQWDSQDYFTDEQLETSKNLLAIDDAYSKEKTSDFVHTVTYWWAVADIQYYTNYVENLQKVTREDITRYVKTYIKDKPRVMGILVNEDQLADVIFE